MLADDRPLSRLIDDTRDLRIVTVRSHRPSDRCDEPHDDRKSRRSDARLPNVIGKDQVHFVRFVGTSARTPSVDPPWNRSTCGRERHYPDGILSASLDSNVRTPTGDDYSALPSARRTFRRVDLSRYLRARLPAQPRLIGDPRRRSFLNRSSHCLDRTSRGETTVAYRSPVTRSAAAGTAAQLGEQRQHRRQLLVQHQDHVARRGQPRAASTAAR